MATLQEITDRMKAAVGEDSGLGKSLKFDLKDAGVIHIDGGVMTGKLKLSDMGAAMALQSKMAALFAKMR